MLNNSLVITPADQRFAEQQRLQEMTADKQRQAEAVSVNKNVGSYSASTHSGTVEQHKHYSMTAEDFKTDGIVGSLGHHRAHDGAVVEYQGMTMTLGMAVQLGLVEKDSNGNYRDAEGTKKMMSQQSKPRKFEPKTIDFENPLLIL
jgi:hypothetical protein